MHRIPPRHGVVLQQEIKQAGQRGQFAPDGGPGQHVRAGDGTEFLGAGEPNKPAEVFQVVLIGAAGTWVVNIGEPFRRCRHGGQLLKLNGTQAPFCRGLQGASSEVFHRLRGSWGGVTGWCAADR